MSTRPSHQVRLLGLVVSTAATVLGLAVLVLSNTVTTRLAGGGVFGLSCIVLLYLLAPPLLSAELHGGSLSAADRLQAIHSLRSFMLQGVGAIALFLGLLFTAQTLRATNESLDLNRKSQDSTHQSQTADQFMRAIDQLGQTGTEKIEVRAGGIYSLGLIVEGAMLEATPDSLELRRTIFRVLQSYLFQHDSLVYTTTHSQNRGTPGGALVDADFQAAVTVLTRHAALPGDDPLQFYSLDLPAVDLRGAHLEGARLDHANLEQADLRGANLKGATLAGTCLRTAQLDLTEFGNAVTNGIPMTDDSHQICGRAARS